MKKAATVATHDFELAVDGLDEVGGRERAAHLFGILQEGEIVRSLLAKLGDPAGIFIGKMITELFELAVTDFEVPSGFDRTPSVLELERVGLRKMCFGIALHVDGAKLNIGMREQAFANSFEA